MALVTEDQVEQQSIEWFKESFKSNNTMGILTKDVLAYVDAFEDENEKDDFVNGELSKSVLKALKNMPEAN